MNDPFSIPSLLTISIVMPSSSVYEKYFAQNLFNGFFADAIDCIQWVWIRKSECSASCVEIVYGKNSQFLIGLIAFRTSGFIVAFLCYVERRSANFQSVQFQLENLGPSQYPRLAGSVPVRRMDAEAGAFDKGGAVAGRDVRFCGGFRSPA
jgi:hypothetical protein